MAISNPYGFSLDNPFSQQPSFIGDAAGNIVGSKKKSRVEFQDGSFVRLPKEKPPVPEEDRRTAQYNNPGNLKTIYNGQLMSNTLYAGALPQGYGETNAEGLQKGYFSDPVLGTRALFVDINTKLKRFKDLTPTDQITAIVNQYAPVGKENPNQTNYRNFLLQKFKDNPDQDIARTLVEGIIQFENNPAYEKLYTTEVINEAEKLSKYNFDWNKIKTIEDARKSILSGSSTESSSTVEDSVEEKNKRHFTEPFVDRKVSNRFKLFEPKNLTEKALQGYQDLEDKLFKYADDVRKLSFGMQLEDAYPKNSQSRKNIEDNFAFIIDDMADQVIRGQAYINTNNYTKFIPENNDESVYGGASDLRGVSALEKYRKQELVDYLHEMYQSRVYDVVNSGLTEEEVMASSPKSIRELKDSVPGDRHIDAGHALEHRARKKYKDAKDPFLVDPNKTKPKAKPMPNPSQKSIITKPKFLDI